jgi:hypothetical protein
MQDLSCFKKDWHGVTQIKGILPSIDSKPIEIPKVKINPSPVALCSLSAKDVAFMVDHVVSASLANRLQKQIDGSVDSRSKSIIDSKVRWTFTATPRKSVRPTYQTGLSTSLAAARSSAFSV